jgi:hypothetical protein
MAEHVLYGIPVPPGAVRLVVRPSLGRGSSEALFEGRLEGQFPTEDEIRRAAAKDVEFWQYIDAAVKSKRIETPRDGMWSWRLRLEFYNQLNSPEHHTTAQEYEFYRATSASSHGEADPEARLAQMFDRGMQLLDDISTKALDIIDRAADRADKAADRAEKIVAHASDAIAKVSTASSAALAEASKQTAVVSDLAKTMQQETVDLKDAIFKLQSERAQNKAPPKSGVEEAKDLIDTAKMMMGLADSLGGGGSETTSSGTKNPDDTGAK